MTEVSGTVRIESDKKLTKIVIQNPMNEANMPVEEEVSYEIPFGMRLTVQDGQMVVRGQQLTEGFLNPADVLHMSGIDAVYDYIIREVQKVYRGEDVEINDKHVECITRQMTRKVKIEDPGDTDLLVGTTVDILELREENEKIEARIAAGEEGLRFADAAPMLLGITKASLMTESFLSAASFQETTKVLTDAAIHGKQDHLLGLKENVIIGKLIPAGTGLGRYRSVGVVDNAKEPDPNLETVYTAGDEYEEVLEPQEASEA